MIPKIIHYVWLSDETMPPFARSCISSWKKLMPEYTIKWWNLKNFDVESVPWVKEAIMKKKWAFATDYIRCYALYTEGGIYMDTDVKVFRSFSEFLNYDFFSSIEYHPDIFENIGKFQVNDQGIPYQQEDTIRGLGIQAAILASSPGNAFVKECMDYMGTRHFVREDGTLEESTILPDRMATIAVKYGFRYKDEKQFLKDNMVLFDSSVFAGNEATFSPKKSYAFHYCNGSWREHRSLKVKLRRFLRNYILKR